MPRNSVLIRPKVDTNASRHDFDRSFVLNYNQSHGELRPVFCEPVVAGTKGVINCSRFTRSAKVVFPAFQQVDQHIEFFKVPIRYLWSKWNDWKLNINDLNSSALVDYRSTPQPHADLSMAFACPRINIGVENGNSIFYRMGINTDKDAMAQMYKLFDDLDCCPRMLGNVANQFVINLFKFGAYQKVYFDHYRNSTYESNNPFAYNFDWLTAYNNLLEPSDGTQSTFVCDNLFQIRYKNYRNDYFHNIYPSLNYSQSLPDGSDWVLPNGVSGVANLSNPSDLASFVTGNDKDRWHLIDGSSLPVGATVGTSAKNLEAPMAVNVIEHEHEVNGTSQFSNRASISVQQIRSMFALDKLLRASAYAPKHVREQYAARYGVKLSDKVSFESERLGSFKNDIVFGEVTATSDTYTPASGGTPASGQQLGAISGKGIGSSPFGRDIQFYAEEDSIIIGIQYFLARANYDFNLAVDEWSTKLVKNDFFIREFEHLGLRPMYAKYHSCAGTPTQWNAILGFQEANLRYKVSADKNHGLFNEYYVNYGTGSPVLTQSELSSFTVHTYLDYIPGMNGVPYTWFQARPRDLDYIFEVNYDKSDMSTDQFYGQIRFKFYVNAPMDVHSQPFL